MNWRCTMPSLLKESCRSLHSLECALVCASGPANHHWQQCNVQRFRMCTVATCRTHHRLTSMKVENEICRKIFFSRFSSRMTTKSVKKNKNNNNNNNNNKQQQQEAGARKKGESRIRTLSKPRAARPRPRRRSEGHHRPRFPNDEVVAGCLQVGAEATRPRLAVDWQRRGPTRPRCG
jgi:hypothetical protein